MKDFKFLKKISEANGIAGAEGEVREIIKKELLEDNVEFIYDNLGSLIAKKNGSKNDLKISIVAHMDEVGFIVKSINSSGFVKVHPFGGWNPHMIIGSRVVVSSYSGEKFVGIITTDKPTNNISFDDIYVDLGMESKEEVCNLGIRPGDMITPVSSVEQMNGSKNIIGKAWDDRIGCAAMVGIIKKLADKKHASTVFGVASVQEEVGTRGGKTTTEVVEPDIGIVIDVASTKDTPALNGQGRKLNEGPCLVICDKLAIANKKLLNLFIDTAIEKKINFQYDVLSGGGTDSGPIHLHKKGVPCISIVIPVRYAHTAHTIVNYDDYQKTIELITNVIEKIDQNFLDEIYCYKKAIK